MCQPSLDGETFHLNERIWSSGGKMEMTLLAEQHQPNLKYLFRLHFAATSLYHPMHTFHFGK